MGQNPGLLAAIEIAAKAGYDGLELWINDIRDYIKQGNTIESLAKFISSKGLVVENLISFTAWMVDDDTQTKSSVGGTGRGNETDGSTWVPAHSRTACWCRKRQTVGFSKSRRPLPRDTGIG